MRKTIKLIVYIISMEVLINSLVMMNNILRITKINFEATSFIYYLVICMFIIITIYNYKQVLGRMKNYIYMVVK